VIVDTTAGSLISAAAVAERVGDGFAARRAGADAVPLPGARHLEDSVVPSAADVCPAIKEIS
jgi:hypothetical protein